MASSLSDLLVVRNPLIGDDLETCLLSRGWRPRVLDPGQVTLLELERSRRQGFTALLSVNRSPELALACRETGLRYLSWTIDPLSRSRWMAVPGVDEFVFVHRRSLLPPLLAMGHARVEWLPLGAPARRWSDPRGDSPDLPPAFVGSSLLDEQRFFQRRFVSWGMGEAIDALVRFLDEVACLAESDLAYQGFLVEPSGIPASLLQVAQGLVDPLDVAEALDAGLAWRFRRRVVAALASLGCRIRGDEGWAESCGSAWEGPLRNGTEMTSHYGRSALQLDVPRLHQRGIATLRAFDVLACGGVLFLEAGSELEHLFQPGEHYLDWRTPAERDDVVREALGGRSSRLELVAERGREAAWEHRLDVRVDRILAEI